MTEATKKDIEGDLKASLYLYKSDHANLDMEDSLNFLTQLIYVIFESPPAIHYYKFTADEINNELIPFLDPFYFDYCIEKFGRETNEFKFWKLFFYEAILGGTKYKYTKESLFSIINEKPGELVPYFPFNAFNVAGALTGEEQHVVNAKVRELIKWVENQPLTTRIKTIAGYMDISRI